MRKVLVALLAVVALVGFGCGNSTNSSEHDTTTTGTPADTLACHDFGTEAIQHGSSTSSQAIEELFAEIESATNPELRNDATSLRNAITNGGTASAKRAIEDIAQTCYRLGLISKTGAPT